MYFGISDELRSIINILFAILTLLGILQTIFPEQAWNIRKGIWYKNAEPGDLAIILTRIIGIIMVVVFGFLWIIF